MGQADFRVLHIVLANRAYFCDFAAAWWMIEDSGIKLRDIVAIGASEYLIEVLTVCGNDEWWTCIIPNRGSSLSLSRMTTRFSCKYESVVVYSGNESGPRDRPTDFIWDVDCKAIISIHVLLNRRILGQETHPATSIPPWHHPCQGRQSFLLYSASRSSPSHTSLNFWSCKNPQQCGAIRSLDRNDS